VLVFHAQNIRLHWLSKERVLVKTCTGYVPSDGLRQACEAALGCLEQNKGNKVLSDNRGLVPTAQADLTWIERDWAPRMAAAGWRYWAVLEPTTALGAMNVRRWVAIYRELGIAIEAFQDAGEAIVWLQRQPDDGVEPARRLP